MNFNFKFKGFEVAVKEDVTVKVEEFEVGYKDVKLSEIPAIIKEVRKTFVELKDIVAQESNPEPEVHREFHVIVPTGNAPQGFSAPAEEETDDLFPFSSKSPEIDSESEVSEPVHSK